MKLEVRFIVLFAIVLVTIFFRFIPHPPNFVPIGAIALFGAAFFRSKILAFAVPLIIMVLSDVILQATVLSKWGGVQSYFSSITPWSVYLSFILVVIFGFYSTRRNSTASRVLASSLAAAIIFFIITNFCVFLVGYPKSILGLIACYTAAIPFFVNTIISNALYSMVLFGGYRALTARYPFLGFRYERASLYRV